MLKKIIFKYTVKLNKDSAPETHYVSAYNEDIARRNLAIHLKVDHSILRLSKKNLPYKIRQLIFSNDDPNYQLTIDTDETPNVEKSVEEIQSEVFNLKLSMFKSIRYKVFALFAEDVELIEEFSRGNDDDKVRERIYKYLRKTIIENGYDKEEVESTGFTLLEFLDAYPTTNFNKV